MACWTQLDKFTRIHSIGPAPKVCELEKGSVIRTSLSINDSPDAARVAVASGLGRCRQAQAMDTVHVAHYNDRVGFGRGQHAVSRLMCRLFVTLWRGTAAIRLKSGSAASLERVGV